MNFAHHEKKQPKNIPLLLLTKNMLYLIGALIGGIAGFLYWKYVGCLTGTCKITSSPVNSTLYFAMMGALLFGAFKKQEKNGR